MESLDRLTRDQKINTIEGLFFQRSAYPFIGVNPPSCFTSIAKELAVIIVDCGSNVHEAYKNPSFILAENLCRRMGDLELYEGAIKRELNDPNQWKAVVVIGSLMVGYFSTAKSILDAGSVALSHLYQLGLSNKEQDFSKQKFWKSLARADSNAHNRYSQFRGHFDGIVKWRDSAVHRLTPFLIIDANMEKIGNRPPEQIARSEVAILMSANPDTDMPSLLANARGMKWSDPLDIPTSWKPKFIAYCEQLCNDIKAKL
jgi:hypothetical protein